MADSSSIKRALDRAISDLHDARRRRQDAIYEYERSTGSVLDKLKRTIERAESDIRDLDRKVDGLQRDFDEAKREEWRNRR